MSQPCHRWLGSYPDGQGSTGGSAHKDNFFAKPPTDGNGFHSVILPVQDRCSGHSIPILAMTGKAGCRIDLHQALWPDGRTRAKFPCGWPKSRGRRRWQGLAAFVRYFTR